MHSLRVNFQFVSTIAVVGFFWELDCTHTGIETNPLHFSSVEMWNQLQKKNYSFVFDRYIVLWIFTVCVCVCVFPLFGWSTAVVAVAVSLFICLFSEAVLFWEFGFFFSNAFLLVCGFLLLSKFFEDFFHVLFLLIDAVPISFPFLEQYTTLDLVWTCRCGSLGFAKLRVLLQFAKWAVSLCLCVCVCVTLLVLFVKNRKFVHSGVTAFKQRMLLFFQWCMRIYFPLEPTTRNLHPFWHWKDCGGGEKKKKKKKKKMGRWI